MGLPARNIEYLLRFESVAQKRTTEQMAAEAGYKSLREYILEAIDEFNIENGEL